MMVNGVFIEKNATCAVLLHNLALRCFCKRGGARMAEESQDGWEKDTVDWRNGLKRKRDSAIVDVALFKAVLGRNHYGNESIHYGA